MRSSSTNFDLRCSKSTWLSLALSGLIYWNKLTVCQCGGEATFIFSLQFMSWILGTLYRMELFQPPGTAGFLRLCFPLFFNYVFMRDVKNSFIHFNEQSSTFSSKQWSNTIEETVGRYEKQHFSRDTVCWGVAVVIVDKVLGNVSTLVSSWSKEGNLI